MAIGKELFDLLYSLRNKIKGKNKHLLRDEYKRRLKVLLKKYEVHSKKITSSFGNFNWSDSPSKSIKYF